MRRRTQWPIIAISLVACLVLPPRVSSSTFCNMDLAGGEKGRKAQEKSARAAAFFLQATATTFQMFAQIELHLAGEKQALSRASALSGQSRDLLSKALKVFGDVPLKKEVIQAVDQALQQVKDYSIALKEAKVPPASPIATSVLDALKKGTVELLQVCSQSIKELQDTDKPMGKVYKEVDRGGIPSAQSLWDAIVQWNEALIKGQLVSSIFTVRKK